MDIIAFMHNFFAKFRKILDIYKEFAGNRVTEAGNIIAPYSGRWIIKSAHPPLWVDGLRK